MPDEATGLLSGSKNEHRLFPEVRNWLPQMDRQTLLSDVVAGLTCGAILVPQSMAYAHLAGVPPLYGMYTAFIPLFIYFIFGTGRQLAVGPVAVVCILIQVAVTFPDDIVDDPMYPEIRMQRAILLTLMVGIFLFLLGIFRVGFIENVLSHPVLSGFLSGTAVIICVEQLPHLLGIPMPKTKLPIQVYTLFSNIAQAKWVPITVAAGSIGILVLFKLIKKHFFKESVLLQCGALVVTLVGTIVSWQLQLGEKHNLRIMGAQKEGLPAFTAPLITYDWVQQLLPNAIVIGLVGYIETLAVSKAQGARYHYDIDANLELIALGLCNLVGCFFHCFPIFGALSRSPLLEMSGAKTQLAGFFSGCVVGLALLFLLPFFFHLPIVCIASCVFVSVGSVIEFPEAIFLWKVHRGDFWMWVLAFIGTIVLGVDEGILICLVFSMLAVLKCSSIPVFTFQELVKDKENDKHMWHSERKYTDMDQEAFLRRLEVQKPNLREDICHCRNPLCSSSIHIIVIKMECSLYFANVGALKGMLENVEKACAPTLRGIVIDGSQMETMDSTALRIVAETCREFYSRGKQVCFSEISKQQIRNMFDFTGLTDEIGPCYLRNSETIARMAEAYIATSLTRRSSVRGSLFSLNENRQEGGRGVAGVGGEGGINGASFHAGFSSTPAAAGSYASMSVESGSPRGESILYSSENASSILSRRKAQHMRKLRILGARF